MIGKVPKEKTVSVNFSHGQTSLLMKYDDLVLPTLNEMASQISAPNLRGRNLILHLRKYGTFL